MPKDVNEKCATCIHECKQFARTIIVCCPKFKLKKGGK